MRRVQGRRSMIWRAAAPATASQSSLFGKFMTQPELDSRHFRVNTMYSNPSAAGLPCRSIRAAFDG
jgi:hypothetical protein